MLNVSSTVVVPTTEFRRVNKKTFNFNGVCCCPFTTFKIGIPWCGVLSREIQMPKFEVERRGYREGMPKLKTTFMDYCLCVAGTIDCLTSFGTPSVAEHYNSCGNPFVFEFVCCEFPLSFTVIEEIAQDEALADPVTITP